MSESLALSTEGIQSARAAESSNFISAAAPRASRSAVVADGTSGEGDVLKGEFPQAWRGRGLTGWVPSVQARRQELGS